MIPDRHQPQPRRQRREREHAPQVTSRDPAPPPPCAPQQNRRQHHHRGLRQQGQQEQHQGKHVIVDCRFPIAECGKRRDIVKMQIRQDARHIERHRQGVLALGDPGHRLDRHRVQREEQARQPRAGRPQSEQHSPEQHRARRVQQHIDHVVTGRVLPPQTPLEPEHAGGQREVIRRLRGEPETIQAVGSVDERVLGQEDVIVPDEPGAEDRRVGEQRRSDDQCGRKEAACGARALRGLAHAPYSDGGGRARQAIGRRHRPLFA